MGSENGILADTKESLSLPVEIEDFDSVLINFINSALAYVSELGVGPEDGVFITGYEETWDQLFQKSILNDVKTLVFIRVKQVFDPPQVGAVINAYNDQLRELEWRINSKEDRYGL